MADANKARSRVKVTLKGEDYILCFGFNEIALLEELSGKSVSQLFDDDGVDSIGVKVMRDALYCGLKHAKPKIKPTDVGNLMSMEEMQGYGEAIGESLRLALNVSKKSEGEEEVNPTPPPKTETISIGTDSSSSPLELESPLMNSGD
jgi:hypothetical protein